MIGLDGSLSAAVSGDPLLRLYAAMAGRDGSRPAHPAHPEGTVAVPLAAFADAAGPHQPELASRWAEFLVRPLVITFRVALDRFNVVVDTDPETVAVELSAQGRLTGRIVVANRPAGDVDQGARHLAQCLDLVAGSLAGADGATDEARSRVWRVAGEELRFLRPVTADLLCGHHALASYVHSIPSTQDHVLRLVLDRVEEHARRRRYAPTLPQPAVMLDLDFVVLTPRRRTRHAAQQVGGARPGAPDGILELAYPDLLSLLPMCDPPAWERFVKANGLRQAYPGVDFEALRVDFCAAFHRPWTHLTWDELTEGAVRFIRDVENRGGTVVFNTGRRERVRAQTEATLARGGLLRPRLLMMPDDRVRPVAELKAEHAAKVTDLDVVAVFDDLADNRAALARTLPHAHIVAVVPPGYITGDEPDSTVDTISTFERLPHPGQPPALSYASSVAELPLADLRARPVLADHGVHLSRAESMALVDRLISRALAAAAETADRTRLQLPNAATLWLVYHVLTRKQFRRGARAAYPPAAAARDMLPYIERNEPIPVVLPAFPVKQADSGLKALGIRPDLAEVALLVRLRELGAAVADVYPPGLRITALTDGNHFRIRPRTVTGDYLRQISDYLHLVGGADVLDLRDIDEVAAERLGPEAMRSRPRLLAAHRSQLAVAYRDLDVAADPAGALDRSRILDPAGPHPPGPGIAEMFRSLIHSVPLPASTEALHWATTLYADLFNVGGAVPPEVAQGRRAILRAAWDDALHYVAVTRTDHDLGYDRIFWPRVRLTLSTSVPDRCGFAGLGGSAIPPWQGTAALDARGHVSTDFAIHLQDQAFVSVYSPLLGADQPWFMAPITMTEPLGRPGRARLAPGFLEQIRLRRR